MQTLFFKYYLICLALLELVCEFILTLNLKLEDALLAFQLERNGLRHQSGSAAEKFNAGVQNHILNRSCQPRVFFCLGFAYECKTGTDVII